MFRKINVNPTGKQTDDCVVRAIAVLMGISWEKAYMALCQRGLLIYDMPNKDATVALYMKDKGYKRHIISNDCPVCYTIRDFCREYPTGKYLVLTGNHAVAVIDGQYYDASDSGMEIPVYYWVEED